MARNSPTEFENITDVGTDKIILEKNNSHVLENECYQYLDLNINRPIITKKSEKNVCRNTSNKFYDTDCNHNKKLSLKNEESEISAYNGSLDIIEDFEAFHDFEGTNESFTTLEKIKNLLEECECAEIQNIPICKPINIYAIPDGYSQTEWISQLILSTKKNIFCTKKKISELKNLSYNNSIKSLQIEDEHLDKIFTFKKNEFFSQEKNYDKITTETSKFKNLQEEFNKKNSNINSVIQYLNQNLKLFQKDLKSLESNFSIESKSRLFDARLQMLETKHDLALHELKIVENEIEHAKAINSYCQNFELAQSEKNKIIFSENSNFGKIDKDLKRKVHFLRQS